MAFVRVLFSAVLFLLAAKAHGRELRLEREAAGFFRIAFGSPDNPPFVEALWHQERVRFWVLSVALGLLALGALFLKGAPRGLSALVVLSWVPTVSFFGLGIYSWVRRGFWSGAAVGSFGWWSMVVVALAVTVLVARGSTNSMLAAGSTLG